MNDGDEKVDRQTPEEAKPVELSDADLGTVAGGARAKADTPTESLSLNFTKIQINYSD